MYFDEVITDIETLRVHYRLVDGFVFTSISEPSNVYDAILIRNPSTCDCYSPKLGFSFKSLDQHIEYIKNNNIKKAIIIAEDIKFITECQTLDAITIVPARTSPNMFDYSPLYEMKNISRLDCQTDYGFPINKFSTVIDCSKIYGLRELWVRDAGVQNFCGIESLEKLSISCNKTEKDLSNIGKNINLKELSCISCSLRSLSGIENLHKLQLLNVSYCRSLSDISMLSKIYYVLRSLEIDSCAKISDFSVLNELKILEFLHLFGSNELPSLNFIKNMKKLAVFTFSMNVQDGDLSPCLNLPYVYSSKNRKHYNLKDKDLPKSNYLRWYKTI